MNKNLHKLYYKDYFKDKGKDLDFSYLEPKRDVPISVKEAIKHNNDALCAANLLYVIPRIPEVSHHLEFELLYPGLVTGIGIGHEASIEGEFKLGMHFDWTYGMPIIYGSSVKGVLKSYFKDFCDFGDADKNAIENDIFEGEGKSIYNRDIFFDAVLIKADSKGRILCPDSITPHKGPLKNPLPITFMKIAPGCKIEFRFKLVETRIPKKEGEDIVISAEEKLMIFKKILETVGIGAKTNVGYGQLKAV